MCWTTTFTCPRCSSSRTDFTSCSTTSTHRTQSRSHSRSPRLSPLPPPPTTSTSTSTSSSTSTSTSSIPTITTATTPPHPAHPAHPKIPATPHCPTIKSQSFLATCEPCTLAYRAGYDQSLQRSLARMSRGDSREEEGEEDPLERFVRIEGREKTRGVFGEWERREVERLCKRRGVGEDEMVFA